jgi:hypothetical protein
MELAIPLIALGGMYVISNNSNSNSNSNTNHNKKRVKMSQEGFENYGKKPNYLPNTDTPPQNYPIENLNQLRDTVQEYPNPNTATDKYFNQNYFEKKERQGVQVGNTPQEVYSLTGDYLNSKEFKHNNMVPFYGGKIKGFTYDMNVSESLLDNMVGTGSQMIKKVEQAPLFKPEDNMNFAYGAPNNSDFYQSRVNPGMKNNNVKPFAPTYVGPGLNQGFSSDGTGGFNSGMEARELWMDKTIDQLRVATNPKMEYTLDDHEGPANAYIKNVGIIGRVEKQRPDTFFINSQDRWLTTTGAEKGQTLRSIQEMGVVRRPNCEVNYPGPAGPTDQVAGYAPTYFEESKRNVLPIKDVPLSSAQGRGPNNDLNLLKTYTNYNNHRASVRPVDTIRSGFSGAIGAVIAPLMDILKPSRKEEVVSNIRVYGQAGASVEANYVNNPADVTKTTTKETTLYTPNTFINNQSSIYVNNYTPMDLTQRDTTSCSTMGNVGGNSNAYGNMDYESAYRQHNNDIKAQTIYNRPNPGGTETFNNQYNVSIARQDADCFNNRVNAPSAVIKAPPSLTTYGKMNAPQYYDECVGCERISPDLLNAFRSNPYTHSLTTSV